MNARKRKTGNGGFRVINERIELVPIDSIQPSPENVNQGDLGVVIDSVARHGFYGVITAQKSSGHIIAGEFRWRAAKHHQAEQVPVCFLDVDDDEARRLRLMDNRSTRLGMDDPAALAELLQSIMADTGTLEGTGFDEEALQNLLADLAQPGFGQPIAGEDDVPEPPAEPVTRLGDLWLCGRHRVLCGDATKPLNVRLAVAGDLKPLLVITDPPYGVSYSKLKDGIPRSGFADHQERWGDIQNDTLTDGPALQAFLESAIRACLPQVANNAAWYFWHPMLTQGTFFAAAAAAAAADILIHRQIIWVKPGFVLTRSGMYHWKHELCFYGWRRGNPPPWLGDKSQTTVWEVGRDDDHGQHPTQKPVELFRRPILNHLALGEALYDPFLGSGTAVIAAETTGRICYGIDIEPRWVDVTVERWQKISSQEAILDGDGRTFDAVAVERTQKAAA